MANYTLGPLEEQRITFDDIASGDLMFDVGGNLGEWTWEMQRLYPGCVCHVFEPVENLYHYIRERFQGNHNVHIRHAALLDRDGKVELYEAGCHGDATGEFHPYGRPFQVECVDVASIMPDELAVLKLNCEGGEYRILPRLMETGLIKNCRHIQVQFHDNIGGKGATMRSLREQLEATHKLDWTGGEWTFDGWTRL